MQNEGNCRLVMDLIRHHGRPDTHPPYHCAAARVSKTKEMCEYGMICQSSIDSDR